VIFKNEINRLTKGLRKDAKKAIPPISEKRDKFTIDPTIFESNLDFLY